MKTIQKILSAGILALVVAMTAPAASSPYTSKTASGASGTTNVFNSQAGSQIRVVGAIVTGDTNNCVLSFRAAGAAYVASQTNADTGTNITINATNGLTGGDLVLLQKSTGDTAIGTVFGYGSSTNLYLTTGGFGAAVSVGDEVFLLGSATTLPVGNATVSWQGEAIFVGNFNRPVVVTCGPALATNRQANVTVRYE